MATTKQKQQVACIQAAYKNGFEAGADEATKRLSNVIDGLNMKIATLQTEKQISYNQMLQARMRAVRTLVSAANELT